MYIVFKSEFILNDDSISYSVQQFSLFTIIISKNCFKSQNYFTAIADFIISGKNCEAGYKFHKVFLSCLLPGGVLRNYFS